MPQIILGVYKETKMICIISDMKNIVHYKTGNFTTLSKT